MKRIEAILMVILVLGVAYATVLIGSARSHSYDLSLTPTLSAALHRGDSVSLRHGDSVAGPFSDATALRPGDSVSPGASAELAPTLFKVTIAKALEKELTGINPIARFN